MILARIGAAVERYAYAARNFGWIDATRLYLWERASKSKRLSHVNIRTLRRKFFYRGFDDFNAMSHLMTIGYRISDANADRKIQWVIDAGANIGDETIRFYGFHPQATIIALEPESSNFELLVKNTLDIDRVHCLQEGLWSQPAYLKVIHADDHISHRVAEAQSHEKGAIRATSIPDLMNRYSIDQIDILKMDIEGGEAEVFSGRDLAWLERVRCMIFEVPDNDAPYTTQSIYRALDRLGLRFQTHVHGECIIMIRADEGLGLARTAALDMAGDSILRGQGNRP
jgi:FkbM family methyltransferase